MFLNLFEENYEKKIWKIEKLDTNRARVVGDLLQIDPIKLSDFSTYSCMYVDEFGERGLVFKFDQSLFDDIDSLVYSTRTSLYPKSTRKMQTQETKLVRLKYLKIESEFQPNSFDIKIKCKTNMGKLF